MVQIGALAASPCDAKSVWRQEYIHARRAKVCVKREQGVVGHLRQRVGEAITEVERIQQSSASGEHGLGNIWGDELNSFGEQTFLKLVGTRHRPSRESA